MKFLDAHRNDILTLFSDLGLEATSFSFSKKKGRVIIQHEKSKDRFSYYQKLDFDMDMKTKQRIDLSVFEVKMDSQNTIIIATWSLVLEKLKSWLTSLNES